MVSGPLTSVHGGAAPGAAPARASWLWASPPDAEPDAPAESLHPDGDRLVELAEGEPPTLDEARHVARCARCVREIADVVLVIAMVRHGAGRAAARGEVARGEIARGDVALGAPRAPRAVAARRRAVPPDSRRSRSR